jgi:hypothetical protein
MIVGLIGQPDGDTLRYECKQDTDGGKRWSGSGTEHFENQNYWSYLILTRLTFNRPTSLRADQSKGAETRPVTCHCRPSSNIDFDFAHLFAAKTDDWLLFLSSKMIEKLTFPVQVPSSATKFLTKKQGRPSVSTSSVLQSTGSRQRPPI